MRPYIIMRILRLFVAKYSFVCSACFVVATRLSVNSYWIPPLCAPGELGEKTASAAKMRRSHNENGKTFQQEANEGNEGVRFFNRELRQLTRIRYSPQRARRAAEDKIVNYETREILEINRSKLSLTEARRHGESQRITTKSLRFWW